MNNILNAIRLDFYTVKSIYRTAILTYLIAILIGFTTQPTTPILIIMVFTVFFSGTVFSLYEKNHLNKLYGILPLGKSDVVIGRYLYAFSFGVIQAILASVIAYIISILTHTGIDYFTFIVTLSFAFLYYCFSISLAYPIYFKFGFSKAYIFTMLPIYVIFLGGFFISKRTNLLDNLQQIISYFSTHQVMVLVTGIGLGLVLLVISCLISYFAYKRSEL